MIFSSWNVVFVIVLALLFDFINGFHDAGNSIATVVSTRVLRPQHALLWAAFFNFIAFLFFEPHVAHTVGRGLVDVSVIDDRVLFAALFGAIVWGVVTWYFAIPSSSSHALVGGLVGPVLLKVGVSALLWSGLTKVLCSIILSPLIGMVLGMIFTIFVRCMSRNSTPQKAGGIFRKLQFLSATFVSLGHGANDAQKTMGIIALLLFSHGSLQEGFQIPFWVVLVCQFAMGFGTLMGGSRIVKAMGSGITKLKPMSGFSAEASGAMTLFLANYLGIPVSTTHTITGSIVGVGWIVSPGSVRWSLAGRIFWAWIFTIPASALLSSLVWFLVRL